MPSLNRLHEQPCLDDLLLADMTLADLGRYLLVLLRQVARPWPRAESAAGSSGSTPSISFGSTHSNLATRPSTRTPDDGDGTTLATPGNFQIGVKSSIVAAQFSRTGH